MISGKTKLAGFFASPASHSLSPMMHNTSFEACGVDAIYLAFDVDQESLEQAVASIRTFSMLGVNVSMPNKTAVIDYLDELSPEAKLIGAVNTIVNHEGRLTGYNTDGMGFVRSVKETGHSIENRKITVLGAGGAAKAIIVQMALEGAREIVVYKRKNATFLPLKSYFDQVAAQTGCLIRVCDYADEDQLAKDLASSDVLVNATDIGMGTKKDSLPIANVGLLHADLAVFDLIYSPKETRLLQEAKKIGAKGYNGLGMLIHQGAIAFELWTQKEMPVQLVREKIEGR
ncbi:shikimate dehydrogenase [Enterococcus durans]|uniref:shikimate dehydrogenase n=1 Tax=Enterococcus durans TaxID=53345 RepID=UPI001430B89D|nr:shikimate dehydrogenase [Enterococcus durans]NJE64899.1 shikimate dehydrogenase [Enterococcus durans]